jgi:hypothetical protein
MCAHDVSKRIIWHDLSPSPERGASRIIGFIESLIDDKLHLKSELAKAWKRAKMYKILTPDRIPERQKSLSFCSNSTRVRDGVHNIFRVEKLSIEYLDSDGTIRISNFPEGTLETFARVDSSCGSNQKFLDKSTTLDIKLPITNKVCEDYSVLVYSSTRNDRILFCKTMRISKELDGDPEVQLVEMFKSLSSSLPEVTIARKQSGIRKFVPIQGP